MSHVYHKHMTQRVPADPYWKYNCTAYSAAMLINDATLGGLYGVNGQAVRRYSNEPVPDPSSPGLNIKQVIAVAQQQFNVTLANRTGNSWATLMTELNNNRRILLQVQWPACNCAHAIVLIRDGGTNVIQASDPLEYSAKAYSENALRQAATNFANLHGGTLWWAMTRPIPKLV